MNNIEALIVPDSDLVEECKKEYLECILAYSSDAVSWEYDIPSRNMSMDFYDNGNVISGRVIFKNYRRNIIDLNLIFPEDEALFEVYCAELDAGKDNVCLDYRAIGENYDIIWFRNFGTTMKDENGTPVKVRGRRLNISREMAEKEIRTPSQDALTGLYHRDKIKELITDECESNINCNKAFILIDIDNFRQINETLGKMQGDSVLQTISGLIYTNFMSKDLIGRIAGDQFLVFCSNIEKDKIIELVNNLRERIKTSVGTINDEPITISIGISFGPKDGNDFVNLYTKADIALAYVKNNGGNNYAFCEPESMKDICAGYTYMKMGRFQEDESRVIKASKKINKKLFDFAFDELSKDTNIRHAIEKIFSEVSLYYGIDRAILHEIDVAHQIINVTSKWCRVDDGADFKNSFIRMDMWDSIEIASKDWEDGYVILENGRGGNIDFFREIICLKYAPENSIIFPIIDNDKMMALVEFQTFSAHEFQKNEIATLNSIVRLIRSYLVSNQVKYELETESIISKNVMDSQKLIYYIVDKNTKTIKYLSPYAKELFPNAAYGQSCFGSLWGFDNPCEVCPINDNLEKSNTVQLYVEERDAWYNITASLMDGTDNKDDILVCVTDVTDFLAKIRNVDSLTIADSFDHFVVATTQFIKKTEGKYGLLSLGIKHFSKINDKYGYVAGDEILKTFAEFVKSRLAPDETVCRIKGDDFVALIQDHPVDVLEKRIATCSRYLNDKFRYRYSGIDIQCFAGYYSITNEDEYINKCIDLATKARNTVLDDQIMCFREYSEELDAKEREEEEANNIIKEALAEDRCIVYFQPKVDINNGDVIGAEALVRIIDREGKLISPGKFIPVAEKNGLIVDIDQRVYEKTFMHMSKWKKEGRKLPLISVNVSRLHILDDDLPGKIKALSDKYDLDPKEIELEITESVFFQDTNRLISMITQLKDMGYIISMDDFGSGYSTLNFLKSLPVDVIKIDGGFFMRNEMDKKSKAIISAIMQLTENLEFKTVSEGVETQEQVDFIKSQGGKCVQGYYFYKPLPVEEFEAVF